MIDVVFLTLLLFKLIILAFKFFENIYLNKKLFAQTKHLI